MKPIFVLATFALLCTSGVATAEPAALKVVKTAEAPAIDGTAESAWSGAPRTMVDVQPIPAALAQSNKAHQKGKYAKKWAEGHATKVTQVGLQAMHTDTFYGHLSVMRTIDLDAHIAKGTQGGKAVLTFEKATDLCHSIGQGAQHDSAMGDRLIPWHTQ